MDIGKITDWLKLISAIIAAVLAVLGSVSVIEGNPGALDEAKTKTVEVAAPDDPRTEEPQEVVAAGDLIPAPDGDSLRDETPQDVPPAVIEEAQEQTAEKPELEGQPVGGAQNYSIKTDYSGNVYSSRNGADIRLMCLHYTVSPNRAGWSDVYAIQNYFKSTKIASATFIIDFEGHILNMVPRAMKPWTQGFFNPWCISWEIIATGSESRSDWLNSALFKQRILASHVRDEARRAGVPLVRVNPSGCNVPAGITDHDSLECGNDHHDVLPNFPWDVFMKQIKEGPKPACGKQCRKYRKRHAHVHKQLRTRCDTKAERKSRPKECKKLKSRNRYIHRLAKKQPWTLGKSGKR